MGGGFRPFRRKWNGFRRRRRHPAPARDARLLGGDPELGLPASRRPGEARVSATCGASPRPWGAESRPAVNTVRAGEFPWGREVSEPWPRSGLTARPGAQNAAAVSEALTTIRAVLQPGSRSHRGSRVPGETPPKESRPRCPLPLSRSARGWRSCCASSPPLQRVPASFGQERMWFQERLRRAAPAVLATPCGCREGSTWSRSAGSSKELVRRHAALRTSFVEQDGRPGSASPRARRAPARGGREGEADAWRLLHEARAQPVRPGAGAAAARACCCAWPRTEHVLLLTMHHIVSDGWSMGVLVRELAALYAAFAAGRPSPLPRAAGAVRGLRGVAARAGCRARCWRRSSAGGGSSWRAHRPCWSCPRTGPRPPGADVPGRALVPSMLPAALVRARCRRSARQRGRHALHGAARRLPGAAVAATPARRTSRWARPSRAATARSSRGSSASSSTRWCCARRWSGDPSFRELLAPGARARRWAPTRTRTCPSRSWWRSCSPSAT